MNGNRRWEPTPLRPIATVIASPIQKSSSWGLTPCCRLPKLALYDQPYLALEYCPATLAYDGDGLTLAEERARGLDPTFADSDGDGLSDGQEILLKTNPLLADSDGMGSKTRRN